MDLDNQSSVNDVIQNLYNENRMLGNSLQESVGCLEKKRISLINKRNQVQVMLHIRFEEIAKLNTQMQQINSDIDKFKAENTKEQLKREELEQKNRVNEEAFNTQLNFQNAVSDKINDCLEEINKLILTDKENTNMIEQYWENLQISLDKYRNEDKHLQSSIKEVVLHSRNETFKLHEDGLVVINTILNYKNDLVKLIDKYVEMETCIEKLPFENCKKHIDKGAAETAKIQKDLHDKKTETVMKNEEVKRRKDKEEFELKHLCEELNFIKEQHTKLQSETQKELIIISEIKQKIDELTVKNNQYLIDSAVVQDSKDEKNKQRISIENEISKFSGVELKNNEIKQKIQNMITDTENKNIECEKKTDYLNKLKEKKNNLDCDLDELIKKITSDSEEKNDIKKVIEDLQVNIDNLTKQQDTYEKNITDEIITFKSLTDRCNENLNELKIKNNSLLADVNKCNENLQQLHSQTNVNLDEENALKKKACELEEKLEFIKSDFQIKLQSEDVKLKDIEKEINQCREIIEDGLSQIPEEYRKLFTVKSEKLQLFTDTNNNIIENHNILLKKEENKLTSLQNTYEESFGIEDRRAITIREEIHKQNNKNNKTEIKCNQFEKKIKLQEKYKVELENRIVARENKLARARDAAIMTRKELLDCAVPNNL
ncbi:uncharacterized protein LOC142325117 [Lycorma delicatula]|uniref:uncharacterized protein LOC142325117 n=1 Tax=Lycorma delicatula TaxID=130591 RepID=UPI003F51A2F7